MIFCNIFEETSDVNNEDFNKLYNLLLMNELLTPSHMEITEITETIEMIKTTEMTETTESQVKVAL